MEGGPPTVPPVRTEHSEVGGVGFGEVGRTSFQTGVRTPHPLAETPPIPNLDGRSERLEELYPAAEDGAAHDPDVDVDVLVVFGGASRCRMPRQR